MLDLRSEREAGFVLEGVGNIKVLGSSSFAAPLSNIDSEYEVKGLPGFGIRLPAGAWPAGDTRPLKLTVLEVNSNPVLAKELEKMGGAKLMGKGIYFEPSGIVFGKPVEIAIPYDNSIDLGNLELNVHRHHATKGFQKISLSSQRVSPIDSFSKTIFAETLSFSMYAPLATPLSAVAEEAETATVENITVTEPEEPTKGLPMGVIVAATVGSVGFVLLVMAIYCWCCRNRRENTQKKASITKEEARPAQRGITPYEARATRDLPSSPEVPKNAQKQRGDLERAMPVDPPPPSEPAPPTTYSTRYAPEVPPPEEEAPVLHMESPRYGDSATPPMTPNAPILSSEYSMQVPFARLPLLLTSQPFVLCSYPSHLQRHRQCATHALTHTVMHKCVFQKPGGEKKKLNHCAACVSRRSRRSTLSRCRILPGIVHYTHSLFALCLT